MNIEKIVIHHSALNSLGFPEQFGIVNNSHRFRNWGNKNTPVWAKKNSLGFYIQYHYFIERDGTEKIGRTENELGWHSGNLEVNNSSLGICLAGNFDEELPTKKQEECLINLLKELKVIYPDAEIKHHRDIKPTHCPGLKISKDWHKKSNNNNMQYVINEKQEQFLLYDELNMALNIGDPEELEKLKEVGLQNQPKEVKNSVIDKYTIYPLFTKQRGAEEIKKLRDLLGL